MESCYCFLQSHQLFSGDQYVLEYVVKEDKLETKGLVLDEGRVDIVPEPEKEVKPEDVSGSRPGGVLPSDEYPSEQVPIPSTALVAEDIIAP